jgi:transcriptional regulator with XRE-family HTH domain
MTPREALNDAFRHSGLSQLGLACALGVSVQTVNRTLHHTENPPASTLAKWAAACGMEFVIRAPGDVRVYRRCR